MEEEVQTGGKRETFLRVRANRQTRLNARIGKLKRRKPEEGQVCPLCCAPLEGTGEEMNKHVEECLLKREGAMEDDQADDQSENGTRFEEYEWCGQKRVRATSLLEGGFRGTGFAMCSTKESHDSDADLDVDGDDTLEYGKAQYTEADIIPCSGEDQGETKEREALRGAVLNGGMPTNRITPEFSKWASDEMPSTSNGEGSKQEPSSAPRTCKNSEIEKITEDSTGTTMDALKARIRELEKQILRGDRYKCLICMDSYTAPLTSIQCWHVHCEECWLRTLVRTHTHTHIYIYTHPPHTHTHTHIYTHPPHTHTHIYTHPPRYTHTHTHIYTHPPHTHTHTYIHTHTHIYTHTHS
ncbi:E3 ubiquitin-protein ligase RNF220a isoform X10 [Brachyhypopomus gauderio]|uniref:E3 ubiquitin-protein ligase RNF220a isoform X10 n=1 Tax=Brachyhypopomus gauderio TaxID=698409 RepID=UPI0040425705